MINLLYLLRQYQFRDAEPRGVVSPALNFNVVLQLSYARIRLSAGLLGYTEQIVESPGLIKRLWSEGAL